MGQPTDDFLQKTRKRTHPLSDDEEKRIVDQLRCGDSKLEFTARQQLVAAHLPMILRMTREYPDVGGIVMLNLLDPKYKMLSSYEAQPNGSITAWISGVVGYALLKESGRRKTHNERYVSLNKALPEEGGGGSHAELQGNYDFTEVFASSDPGPDQTVYGRQLGAALTDAFSKLTTKQQAAVALSVAGGLDGVEGAKVLGLANQRYFNKRKVRELAAIAQHPVIHEYLSGLSRI